MFGRSVYSGEHAHVRCSQLKQASSLIAILVRRAAAQPDRTAYHFIGDDPGSDIKLIIASCCSRKRSAWQSRFRSCNCPESRAPGLKSNFFFIVGF